MNVGMGFIICQDLSQQVPTVPTDIMNIHGSQTHQFA